MNVTDEEYKIGTRQQEYRKRNDDYRDRESKRTKTTNSKSSIEKLWNKPFVGWDSEGDNRDRSIFLFGNSEHDRIAHPNISSAEMLDLILETETRIPDAIHIIFGGEYDFNMFLRDVPLRCLLALRETGKCQWNGYKIEHIPRKWFVVKRDGLVAKIFDIQLFFASSYVAAITDHGVGSDEQRDRIIEGKAQRSDFGYEHLSFVEPYWRTELALLPLLAEKLRDAFYGAGMYITSWHGPGALARNILRNRDVKLAMKPSPEPVLQAARYAFCGGRFESFKAGRYEGTIYNADINSAYPYAATFLPDLNKGEWRYDSVVDRTSVDAKQFAMYHIRYRVRNKEGFAAVREPKPLFRRFSDDRVGWTSNVTGWYWSPEAELVKDDPRAEFIESWTFDGMGRTSYPFTFLSEYYDIRSRLKAINNPMQLSFKLGPNSVYGQLAQRAGWEHYKGAPTFHQLEWAGYVTSTCRAMIHKVAKYAWDRDGLVSIDTDGVYTTCPLPADLFDTGIGKGLGQWDLTTLPGILYWQSGVFYVPDNNGDWQLKKSRGAPKGKVPYAAADVALANLEPLRYQRTEFIGYRRALKQRGGMDKWRHFVTDAPERPRKIDFGGSPWSKRWHNPRGCRACKGIPSDGMHDLYPSGNGMSYDSHSYMHVLPWIPNDHERLLDPIDEKSGLIVDEEWLGDLAI